MTVIDQIRWNPSVRLRPVCVECGWDMLDDTDIGTAIWYARNHLCDADDALDRTIDRLACRDPKCGCNDDDRETPCHSAAPSD